VVKPYCLTGREAAAWDEQWRTALLSQAMGSQTMFCKTSELSLKESRYTIFLPWLPRINKNMDSGK